MTPREVLAAHLGDDFADLALAALKDAALFIGPEVATSTMKTRGFYSAAWTNDQNVEAAGDVWTEMRIEWQRGGGA